VPKRQVHARARLHSRKDHRAQHAVLEGRRAGRARLLHVADAVRADRSHGVIRVDRFSAEQLHLFDILVEPDVALRDVVDTARRIRTQDRVVVFLDRAVLLDHEVMDITFDGGWGYVVARGGGGCLCCGRDERR
jgi:hypothetical protein